MKKYTWGACFVLLCAAFGWSTKIDWQWKGQTIFTVDRLGSRLELGLRDDGVVVWREITNATNSPAERRTFNEPYDDGMIIITNWQDGIITNGYFQGVPNASAVGNHQQPHP